ncbi:MAG: hypothetical protein P8N31_01780 [Planctomycetota bacterium]|jgi:hypothetical protein|nr:hypothetical protein [Planctomycetota bacterium]MDG2142262.1 hypothetical protein [Planctomycetota bacterium]
MARRSESRRPQKKSGAGAAVAAFGVLGVLVAIIILGIMASNKAKQDVVKPPVVEVEDRWAGLPPDVPTARKKPVGGSGFSGASFESQEAAWLEAQEVQSRAAELHSKSSDLRLEGDAEWHNVAAEAKELYEEAVEKARAYRTVYAGEFGEDSTLTKRLDKKIEIWNRALVGLRKTAR